MMMRNVGTLVILAGLALGGCGDDDSTGSGGSSSGGSGSGAAGVGGSGGDGAGGEGGHEEESPDEEACEHFEEGPFNMVTAGMDINSAPDIDAEHTSHQVTLVADGADFGGMVSFGAEEATDFIFFLDTDVPLQITDANGSAVAIEESCDPSACSDACDTIAGRHVVELEVGTYYLTFGPTSETAVAVVHEEAAGHDEEE